MLDGKKVKLSSLYLVLTTVFVFSIIGGYGYAVSTWLVPILHDLGWSAIQIGNRMMYLSILGIIVGNGILVLILVASYYSGRKYVLTVNSAVVAVLLLIFVSWGGRILGCVIGQIQFPKYPVLNINLILQLTDLTVVVWSMLGIVAGNYRREVAARVSGDR